MRFLTKKQKVLLVLINELGKKGMSSKLGIEKALFVLKEEEHVGESIKFYSFFPYNLGPYSYVSYMDMGRLKSGGYLGDGERSLTAKGMDAVRDVEPKIVAKIKAVAGRFDSDTRLKDHVYEKYPSYTIKSLLVRHEKERGCHGIYSIGYEGRDIDAFLDLLIKNRIDILVDIRNNPFSMNFSFTKNRLVHYLEKSGIKYVGMPELGIEGRLRAGLVSVRDYRKLFEAYSRTTMLEQKEKVSEIMELGKVNRVAMMCFERDKDMCHRGVVSAFIMQQGMGVVHL